MTYEKFKEVIATTAHLFDTFTQPASTVPEVSLVIAVAAGLVETDVVPMAYVRRMLNEALGEEVTASLTELDALEALSAARQQQVAQNDS